MIVVLVWMARRRSLCDLFFALCLAFWEWVGLGIVYFLHGIRRLAWFSEQCRYDVLKHSCLPIHVSCRYLVNTTTLEEI